MNMVSSLHGAPTQKCLKSRNSRASAVDFNADASESESEDDVKSSDFGSDSDDL